MHILIYILHHPSHMAGCFAGSPVLNTSLPRHRLAPCGSSAVARRVGCADVRTAERLKPTGHRWCSVRPQPQASAFAGGEQ